VHCTLERTFREFIEYFCIGEWIRIVCPSAKKGCVSTKPGKDSLRGSGSNIEQVVKRDDDFHFPLAKVELGNDHMT